MLDRQIEYHFERYFDHPVIQYTYLMSLHADLVLQVTSEGLANNKVEVVIPTKEKLVFLCQHAQGRIVPQALYMMCPLLNQSNISLAVVNYLWMISTWYRGM